MHKKQAIKTKIIHSIFVFALYIAFFCFFSAKPVLAQKKPLSLYEDGKHFLFSGDIYKALDSFTSALAQNNYYSDAWVGLAQCQYKLKEYNRALEYIAEAYKYGPRSSSIMILEAFSYIGLGKLSEAEALFKEVLTSKPNDRDAKFGLALLDVHSGKTRDAKARLQESLRGSPSDDRALLSLALISKAEGRNKEASTLLEEALRWTDGDAATLYVAGLLYSEDGKEPEAARLARSALELVPNFPEASSLLATIYYQSAKYDDARAVLDKALSYNRNVSDSWFLMGLVEEASKNYKEAEFAFTTVSELKPDDEIARISLENLIMDTTSFEDSKRSSLAAWRFDRAAEFKKQLLYKKSAAEYRRGLAIDPYSNKGRRSYAELLRSANLYSTYLSEIEFLDEHGKSDVALKDAIEIYRDVLQGSVSRDWKQESVPDVSKWKISVFSSGNGSLPYHAESDIVVARYLRDQLALEPNLLPEKNVSRVNDFSSAYSLARDAKCDFFVVVDVSETERDILVSAELRLASTGTLICSLEAPRSGNDRVSLAVTRITENLVNVIPFKASILARKANNVLVDKGKASNITLDDNFLVLKKGSLSFRSDGLGLNWKENDVVAKLKVKRLDDELFEAEIQRVGFFDRLNPGDIVIKELSEEQKKAESEKTANVIKTALPSTTKTSSPIWAMLFERLRSLY